MTFEALGMTTGQAIAFAVAFFMALLAIGARVSDYTNRRVGFTLIGISIAGVLAVALWIASPFLGGTGTAVVGLILMGTLAALLVRLWSTKVRPAVLMVSVVRLLEHVDDEGVIRGVRAEDAFVVGPAILLVPGGTHFVDCEFDEAGPLAPIWAQPPEGPVGAIQTEDCVFIRCRFHNVAVGTSEEYRQEWHDIEEAEVARYMEQSAPTADDKDDVSD